MEIELETLRWLIGGFLSSLVVWWGTAFKFRDFYNEKISGYIVWAIILCAIVNFSISMYLTHYIEHLQKILADNKEALNAIAALTKPYENFNNFIWLALTCYFLAWLGLTFLIDSYEDHLRNKGDFQ